MVNIYAKLEKEAKMPGNKKKMTFIIANQKKYPTFVVPKNN